MGVASLENDTEALEKVSYYSFVVARGPLSEGVTDPPQLDRGLRVPTSQSLDRKWEESYVLSSAVVSVFSMLALETRVERMRGLSCTPLDVGC